MDSPGAGGSFVPVGLDTVRQFVTADGSLIRELARSERQTLAEATLPAGGETHEHFHSSTEEIYTFLAGTGAMRLGEHGVATVTAGDTVLIAPGTPHKLWNAGPEPLVLLCCCVPPYSDDDTVMTGR